MFWCVDYILSIDYKLDNMDTFITLFPLVGMSILTAVNFYIAYITFRLLRISMALLEETVVIRRETIRIREISQQVEDKL